MLRHLTVLRHLAVALLGLALLSTTGCQSGQTQAQPSGRPERGQRENEDDRPIAVETAIAQSGTLGVPLQYTGTTAPGQLVSLRSQAEGRLLNLLVDVGDRVNQGQAIGELDDRLPNIAINEARAELASRQAEVDRAKTEVSDAQAQVAQAQVALKQAQADAKRLSSLAANGAISQQQAEQAQTAAASALQIVRSAQERVKTRQQAVAAAEGRVAAQFASVNETQERRSFSQLNAPISGIVTERITEPGNLIQPGNEILKIGNFNTIKIAVQVSELDLAKIRIGQSVQVKFDAFPKLDFTGQVSRIAPITNANARLIPVEVTVPNTGNRITGGLLARVEFQASAEQRIVIPTSALKPEGEGRRGKRPEGKANGKAAGKPNTQPTDRQSASGQPKTEKSDRSSGQPPNQAQSDKPLARGGTIYVVEQKGDQSSIAVRPITLGQERNGQVEVLSGLQPGDRYVIRSDKPLEAGKAVRQSILSES